MQSKFEVRCMRIKVEHLTLVALNKAAQRHPISTPSQLEDSGNTVGFPLLPVWQIKTQCPEPAHFMLRMVSLLDFANLPFDGLADSPEHGM